ncbi:MAG: RNA polymerase sigma factor SigJ [Methylobacterium frigidaeris]
MRPAGAGSEAQGGAASPSAGGGAAPHRPHLLRVAYRMLGSHAEAEDMVQEAYLRWHRAGASASAGACAGAGTSAGIAEPRAWLTRVVARLCLDHLKSARVRRERYVGPWLPEPAFSPAPEEPDADTVTLALMLALERLSPLERAAFLMHDVFGVGFPEVARLTGRSEAAARQLAARARRHVREARPRAAVAPDAAAAVTRAFFEASRSGDAAGLSRLLADDVEVLTDGGGRRRAALHPILGRDRAVRLFAGLARKAGFARPPVLRRGWIDGLPGFATLEAGAVLQTTALAVEPDGIRAVYIVRNPDKLTRLWPGP